MKFKFIKRIFILLIFFQQFVYSQNVDSLKLALKNARHDTVRCKILSVMPDYLPQNEWPKYTEELKTITQSNLNKNPSKDLKIFYSKYLAVAYNNEGLVKQNQGDIEGAMKSYQTSVNISRGIKDEKNIAYTLYSMGTLYSGQSKNDEALKCYHEALEILSKINDKEGLSYVYSATGNVYLRQNNVPKTLEYWFKALKIMEENKDVNAIASVLNGLGWLYSDMKDYDKALSYFERCLKLCEQVKNDNSTATCLNNMGIVLYSQGKKEKALVHYQQALKLFEEQKNPDGISVCLSAIGNLHYDKGEYEKTIEYVNRALKIAEETNSKREIAAFSCNIGKAYNQLNDLQKAEKFGARSLSLSKELMYPDQIANAAELLASVYEKQGKGIDALKMYKLHITMRDSIYNEKNTKELIQKDLQFSYDKKAAADSVKVAEEKKLVAIQLEQEKTQRFALYGGLILVLVFAGFMFNRFKVTQKQKHIIETKEKETQQQNEIISHQKHLVEEKHKEITDSINYAERIQRSFLATKKMLDAHLPEYFVLFKPKDVVSGDFYWASKLNNGHFAFVTADSTGHGVPGAIMSLLNITSLEKASEHFSDPAEILGSTRKTIIERLKKDGSPEGGKDGMDCSLMAFDFSNQKLLIAAAHNPVWIVRKPEAEALEAPAYELIDIKPDKMPVGKHDRENEPFTLHTIDLQKGDVIYALTDGFPDQFGGPNGKKFMSKKLKELLLANAHLPMNKQKELLDQTFKDWVGGLEQVDDVTVVGIRI